MPQTADVFVSYSREDKDKVLSLTEELKGAGVSVWIDQGGIDAATIWGEEIVNAIEGCKVLLLMILDSSVGSQNVMREVMLISEKKKHILPVHLTPTTIPATLKYPLAGIQHVEYFRGTQSENIQTIVRSLQRAGVELHPQKKGEAALVSQANVPQITSSEMPEEWTRSIAILPFENNSSDPDTEYFCDGLTDELIAILSRVDEIDVVSRLTSVQYKGTHKDARTIGHELQARYIVSGTVRKFQDNLRITIQLVDAKTNKQLWAQTYKGKLDDIFDIQEQVGQQIADSLKLKLSLNEKVALTKRPTANAQAYDLYLRGKEYLYQLTKKSVEYSIQLFEKAIELDPRYADAYAGCSNAYVLLYSLFNRADLLKDRAQELGLKALMYDSNSAEAYAALALSYFYRHDYDEAIAAGKKAINLDPDNFLAYWLVGRVYFSMGLYEEARITLERSHQIEASFYTTNNDLELTYKALGLNDKADEMCNRLLEYLPTHLIKYPDDSRARVFYAGRLAKIDKVPEAKAEAKLAMEQSPDDPLMLYNTACVFSVLGEIELAVESLKNSFKAGYQYADWITRDSDLDPIRNDPGYVELMKDK